ncbi:DUF2690 domain-containing protein [Kitasatospora sp. NPDC059463]|uniref:DUF2690 domain-containing protein n=1 Tax=unclassified Kitasatospora TaxID=2633591 RepID=UPI0036A0CF8E
MSRSSALVLAAAALLAPAALAPVPAQAAVACHGNACDGGSPKSAGCAADARTVPGSEVPKAADHVRAWLRYSRACHAVWAQADASDGWEFAVQIRGGASHHAFTVTSGPTYTAMVGADHEHRVRLRDFDNQWEDGPWRKGGS